MENPEFQTWHGQPSYFKPSYQDVETCSQLSNTEDLTVAHSPPETITATITTTATATGGLGVVTRDEPERTSLRKMAIPRLPEGPEATFSSPGRFHRRHVRRACESCRQRKTKCTGDKSGCRNCREAGVICCYTDGKREKSKRQLASLSAKVQAYEEIIRKISLNFGLTDEQVMNGVMTIGRDVGFSCHPDITAVYSRGQNSAGGTNSERNISRSSSVASLGEADRVEEDFNRDEATRATGFIGRSSEISWLQRLSKEVNSEACGGRLSTCSNVHYPHHYLAECAEIPSSPFTSGFDGHGGNDAPIASLNYYADNVDLALPKHVNSYEMPPREVANRLFNTYLTSVHPSFPIIGTSTFISQYQLFFSQPTVKPGNKWLAILNLIFAIAAQYSHLVLSEWKSSEDDHLEYYSRAKALSLDGQFLAHPDLQQLQVEGLTSIYLLSTGQINRSWKLSGSAVRGAMALGLHLRNVGAYTSDTSKEIRYRVWWSLYTVDHLLSVMTGRPSCIIDSTCTTPLPVPFDEGDFQKEEVAQLLGNPKRTGSWAQELPPTTDCSGISTPDHVDVSQSIDGGASSSQIPNGSVDFAVTNWLKTLPLSKSLYFLHLARLTSVAKRANIKLYSAEAVQSPWPNIEFTIQSFILEADTWLLSLPEPYDFTSSQPAQSTVTQRMSLGFVFYGTKIAITRPCLCRLEKYAEGSGTYDFCSKTAAECVEAASQMLGLLPDTPDTVLLNQISPWWCILHYFMQATTVLLLELSFRAQHVPDKAVTVSQMAKKAIEWLRDMSRTSTPAHRAWKLCDDFLRRLAPQVGINVNDLPHDEPIPSTNAATNPITGFVDINDPIAAATASLDCSSSGDMNFAVALDAAAMAAADTTTTTSAVAMVSASCSLMDDHPPTGPGPGPPPPVLPSTTIPVPSFLDQSTQPFGDVLDSHFHLPPEKHCAHLQPQSQHPPSVNAAPPSTDFLPYDPATGHITGSFFPPTTAATTSPGSNVDMIVDIDADLGSVGVGDCNAGGDGEESTTGGTSIELELGYSIWGSPPVC